MNALLASLRDIRALAEFGEPLDVDLLSEALARLPDIAPELSRAELEELKLEVDAIFALAEEQRDDIVRRLDEIHQGREALQGYNHLKAFHTAQRLSKRA
jgi:hypothetical protein